MAWIAGSSRVIETFFDILLEIFSIEPFKNLVSGLAKEA